jgi:hypothetical protein
VKVDLSSKRLGVQVREIRLDAKEASFTDASATAAPVKQVYQW